MLFLNFNDKFLHFLSNINCIYYRHLLEIAEKKERQMNIGTSVTASCKLIRFICETAEAINSIDKIIARKGKDHPVIRASAIGFKILIIGLNACEWGAQLGGAPKSTLKKFKIGELAARVIDFPIKVTGAAFQFEKDQCFLKFVLNGIASPFISCIRALKVTSQKVMALARHDF